MGLTFGFTIYAIFVMVFEMYLYLYHIMEYTMHMSGTTLIFMVSWTLQFFCWYRTSFSDPGEITRIYRNDGKSRHGTIPRARAAAQ